MKRVRWKHVPHVLAALVAAVVATAVVARAAVVVIALAVAVVVVPVAAVATAVFVAPTAAAVAVLAVGAVVDAAATRLLQLPSTRIISGWQNRLEHAGYNLRLKLFYVGIHSKTGCEPINSGASSSRFYSAGRGFC
jgi:hypothetical protein